MLVYGIFGNTGEFTAGEQPALGKRAVKGDDARIVGELRFGAVGIRNDALGDGGRFGSGGPEIFPV